MFGPIRRRIQLRAKMRLLWDRLADLNSMIELARTGHGQEVREAALVRAGEIQNDLAGIMLEVIRLLDEKGEAE